MRALTVLFALPPLLLMAATPLPIAPGAVPSTAQLAADSARQWVPFTLTPGNQISFTATFDGTPLAAILDTGLSYSVLSRAYVRKAGIQVTQQGDATVIGGVVPIGWAATRVLSVGGLTRHGGEIAVADVPALATGGQAIDLLIGPDLFADYALDIDYADSRFRVLPSGQLPFRGGSAPLMISPATNFYLTEAALDGHPLRPLMVDTGDGSMLVLSHGAWAAAEPDPPPMTTATTYGFGGVVVTGLAIVPEVQLGDVDARQIEVRIEPPGGFSDTQDAAGRIGTGLLQRYRVLLDPGARRMVLAPGLHADQVPVKSTSGLLLHFEQDRLRVMHVMLGSPAAAAGWKQGETICSVDGKAVAPDYPTGTLSRWSIATPGRSVTLGTCGGETRTLTLRDFY